jgi:hypothetical protein
MTIMNRPRTLLACMCLVIASLGITCDLRAEGVDHLEPLAWLVGEWTGTTDGGVVLLSAHWSDEGHYLVREFLVRGNNGEEIACTQRIGWDPIKRRLKSWSFDSQGGYGEGYWRPDGNSWIVDSADVTADGHQTKTSATYTPSGDGRFVWEIKNVRLLGQPLPDQRIDFRRADEDPTTESATE